MRVAQTEREKMRVLMNEFHNARAEICEGNWNASTRFSENRKENLSFDTRYVTKLDISTNSGRLIL